MKNPLTGRTSAFSKRRILPFLGILALLAGALGLVRYGNGDKAGPEARMGNRVQPVSSVQVSLKDMPFWISAIGTATPRNRVTLRSRVDGELLRLHFTEGEMVQQGQLLAEIDARAYQVQLAQAKGQLARDTALLQNARLDLERYQELLSKDSIARQQVDTQAALVRQYEGTVENDKGQVDNAKLQLSYTRITAPIAGRVGLRQVDPGNQVHASDANGLTSIAQIEPMTVVFSVPENLLSRINRRMAEAEPLPVEAWDREQKTRLGAGRLLTTDNQIDPATGTIKLKAEFANADHALFPNQFVNVKLLLGMREKAMVVPAAAVLRGSQGFFVYAIDAEGTARSVPVTPGVADGELMTIEGALQPGDKIVQDGADRLRDGGKVEVITPREKREEGKKEGRRGKREGQNRLPGSGTE